MEGQYRLRFSTVSGICLLLIFISGHVARGQGGDTASETPADNPDASADTTPGVPENATEAANVTSSGDVNTTTTAGPTVSEATAANTTAGDDTTAAPTAETTASGENTTTAAVGTTTPGENTTAAEETTSSGENTTSSTNTTESATTTEVPLAPVTEDQANETTAPPEADLSSPETPQADDSTTPGQITTTGETEASTTTLLSEPETTTAEGAETESTTPEVETSTLPENTTTDVATTEAEPETTELPTTTDFDTSTPETTEPEADASTPDTTETITSTPETTEPGTTPADETDTTVAPSKEPIVPGDNDTTDISTPSYETIHERADYVVRDDDGKACLLASLNVTIRVTYEVQEGPLKVTYETTSAEIPRDAAQTGTCGATESLLSLSWENGTFTLNITFVLSDKEFKAEDDGVEMEVVYEGSVSGTANSTWRVTQVSLSYDTSNTDIFPGASDPKTVSVSVQDLNLFRTPLGAAYLCQTTDALEMESKNVHLEFNYVHFQPFGVEHDQHRRFANNTVECSGDLGTVPVQEEAYTVPLIVASCLAAAVVIIIIAYASHRYVTRRLRQSEYKQME